MNLNVSSNTPTYLLEQKAVEQRRRLHNSVSELREQVRGTVREKLDVKKHARQYVWPAAGTAFLMSLLFGYGTAGTFKHMLR